MSSRERAMASSRAVFLAMNAVRMPSAIVFKSLMGIIVLVVFRFETAEKLVGQRSGLRREFNFAVHLLEMFQIDAERFEHHFGIGGSHHHPRQDTGTRVVWHHAHKIQDNLRMRLADDDDIGIDRLQVGRKFQVDFTLWLRLRRLHGSLLLPNDKPAYRIPTKTATARS